jgi:hypothetical protein
MGSTEFSSGEYGGKGSIEILAGTTNFSVRGHAARSATPTPWLPGETAAAIKSSWTAYFRHSRRADGAKHLGRLKLLWPDDAGTTACGLPPCVSLFPSGPHGPNPETRPQPPLGRDCQLPRLSPLDGSFFKGIVARRAWFRMFRPNRDPHPVQSSQQGINAVEARPHLT